MFKKFFIWLQQSQPSGLESYILSKRPTNAAEVEYWTIQYGYRTNKEIWL